MRLADKAAIVTGAASGMGRACAVMFAREGARVVAADVNDAGCMETVAGIKADGGEALFVHTDVSIAAEAENLARTTRKAFGRIDVLLNVAGIPQKPAPIEDISDALWDRIYSVNVKGVFHTMKYAIPFMKEARSGAIVNVASIGGLKPLPNGCAYASSKGAIITLTKAVALELAPYGIRVNCINPSGTDTPFNVQMAPEGADPGEFLKDLQAHIPLGRFIRPEEVAYAAVYLASDEALMLSGTYITINAGVI